MKEKTVLLKSNGISDEILMCKLDIQSNKNEYIKYLIWKDILENGLYTVKELPERVNPYTKKEEMEKELMNSRCFYRFCVPRNQLYKELSSFFSLMSEKWIYSQMNDDTLPLVEFFREKNLNSKPVKKFREWHYIRDKIDDMTELVRNKCPEFVNIFENLKTNEDTFTLNDILDAMISSWDYIEGCRIVTFRCLKVMADIAIIPETEPVYHEFWELVETLCSSWKTLEQQKEERMKTLLSRITDTILREGAVYIMRWKDAEWGDIHCCIRKFSIPSDAYFWFCDTNDEFPNASFVRKENAVRAGYKDGMTEYICDTGMGTFL